MRMEFKQRDKALLIAASLVVAVFILERSWTVGIHRRMAALDRQIKVEEERFKKDMYIQNTKDKTLADYQTCKPYLEILQGSDEEFSSRLLREVESRVRVASGTIVTLNPSNTPTKVGVARYYTAEVRLEIDYKNLVSFLSSWEETKRLIRFDRIAITSLDEQTGKLRVDGRVSMVALE